MGVTMVKCIHVLHWGTQNLPGIDVERGLIDSPVKDQL